MPISIDILDFKCFNQLRNGENFDQNLSEFTPNLVGNIGEKVKIEFSANVSQTSFTDGAETWTLTEIVNDSVIDIERSSGSFLEDSVQVGDTFTLYPNWSKRRAPGVNEGPSVTGTVDFVSSDGSRLRFTINSFIPPFSSFNGLAEGTNVGIVFDQLSSENLNTAIFLKFGLIGNDETFNFLSKTTGSQQVYYRGELSPSGGVGVDPTKVQAESLGSIKDWVSGRADVGLWNQDPDFSSAQYQISHEFVLNPFYILAYREFIDNGTIPELLAGDNSIKYAFELELRKTLSNTGSSKIQSYDSLPGFVGWYGENFNGLNKKYQVSSIAYEDAGTTDPLEGININLSTKATITIDNIDGPITDYSCSVHLIKVPDSEDDYIGTTSNLLENFLYKSEVVSSPATSTTNVTTSLVSGDLVIEYTIDYTTAEKLQLTTNDEYLLLVQVEDPTISAGNSDRIMLIADLKNYVDVDYLSLFVNVPQYRFAQHGQEVGAGGQNTPIVSNEDGIVLDAVFGINTVRNAIVNSIDVNLIAYNSTENKSFELDNYSFNIGDPVLSGGVQQIEVNGTRGYPLPAGDDFNIVKIETGSQNGDYREYTLQFAQKITWQDWIFNPQVDNVFFDSSQPNNNLNEKSSNYSNVSGYQIKVALIINVSGQDDLSRTVTGDFINYGGDITVNDYDESDDGVSGVIQTFDVESGNSLQGNILYNGKDTLFRAIFQDATDMVYGIHRIEPSQNQGDGILELSSLFIPDPSNLLKPLTGETQLKFDLVGSVLTTECIIDGSLIQEGVDYKLSARAGLLPPPSPPSAVVASAVAPYTTRVSWSSSTNDHKIYRSTNGIDFTEIASLSNGEQLYYDFNAAYDTDYTYRVTSIVGVAESSGTDSSVITLGIHSLFGFDREGSDGYFKELSLTTPAQTRATTLFVSGFADFDTAYRLFNATGILSVDYMLEDDAWSGNVDYEKYDAGLGLISSVGIPSSTPIYKVVIEANVNIAGFNHLLNTGGDKDVAEGFHNTFDLDTAALDTLYNEVAALPSIPQGITFNARTTQYTAATSGASRTTLINNGWTITDGGSV